MKIGRNEICPCGSGKKYKKCHLFGSRLNIESESHTDNNQYRNNHYVPQWYQSRFVIDKQGCNELYYLNLHPEIFTDKEGVKHKAKDKHHFGFKKCFAQKDLYTTYLQGITSTRIEQEFFGEIDRKGKEAVEYFSNFQHPSIGKNEFRDILRYMSTQKLRTPKGLGWLSEMTKIKDSQEILKTMLVFRDIYCAIWTECVWLIADASNSDTKFIISDHPVTVYNRECNLNSNWCSGLNDPDIRLNGTHTIFPLSLNKVLILTNMSWVRNPYQSATYYRSNPNLFRGSIFKFTDIQTHRYLNESEVRQINFIIKKRANQYIAAANESWLYPEKYVSESDWKRYDNGYLLMPDPRSVQFGGEIIIGNHDGSVTAFDAYGRRPWQPDYDKETKSMEEFKTFHQFQGEFARLYGPYRRGRSFQMLQLDNEKDSDKYHKYHLDLEKKD
jgi:hypothetical protein